MYTKDNLESLKYGDLLKIGKSLGLKGGRQKTNKLIQLILKEQERRELSDKSVLSFHIRHEDDDVTDSSALSSGKVELLEDEEFPESFSTNLSIDNSCLKSEEHPLYARKETTLKRDEDTYMLSCGTIDSKSGLDPDTLDIIDSSNLIKGDKENKLNEKENKLNDKENQLNENEIAKANLNVSDVNYTIKKDEHKNKFLQRSSTFELIDEEIDKRRSWRRSGTFITSEVGKDLRRSLRRTGTFTIQDNEVTDVVDDKISSKSEASKEIVDSFQCSEAALNKSGGLESEHKNDKKAHRRSGTYVPKNSFKNINKRKRSFGSSTIESDNLIMPVKKRRSPIVPTFGQPSPIIDLSCNEVQTAKDIQYLEEEENSTESPFKNVNTPRSRMRRSLRSHLLDSRLSVHQRIAILCGSNALSMKATEDIEEESEEGLSHINSVSEENTGSSVSNQNSIPVFTIGKDVDQAKDQNSASSSIPRFVAYAKKIKSRMPNFNKIHEKAFSKMEALDEYVERKHHSRTKSKPINESLASSVKKISKEANVFRPTVTTTKDLKINFTESKSLFGSKTPVSRVRKSTPSGKDTPVDKNSKRNLGSIGSALKESPNARKFSLNSATKPSLTSISKLKLDINVRKSTHHLSSSNNTDKLLASVTKNEQSLQKAKSLNPTAIPKLIKENLPPVMVSSPWNAVKKDPLSTPGSHLRRKSYNPKILIEISKPTYKPYRGAVGPVGNMGNRDMLKKMAEKNPKIKTSADRRKEQKVFIKGVRTNKRFELQMAKRGIKL